MPPSLRRGAAGRGGGAALPLAGMTGHQRLVRAGGRRLPRETLSCSHQRLARARTTLAIARQGGLPVPMRGSVVSLRPGCPPDIIQTASSFLESSPSTRNVHRVGVCRCPCGEARCVQEGQGMPMQGGGRENMHGVGEEELSAQDCAPGPGPRYSDLCDVKNVSRAAGQHIICR